MSDVFARIYAAILDARRIGLTPETVYLGAEELREMTPACIHVAYPVKGERPAFTVYGVPFLEVKSPAHLAVRGTWPAGKAQAA